MRRWMLLVASVIATAAVGAVIAGVFALGGGGGEAPAEDAVADEPAPVEDVVTDPVDSGAEEDVSRSAGPGGVGEGIGIKGAWELTVLNEDGSVAQRHSFKNDLTIFGDNLLADVLSGERVLSVVSDSPWILRLYLSADSTAGQCPQGESRLADGACTTTGARVYYEGSADAESVNDPNTGKDTVLLSLETEQFAGPATADRVESRLLTCSPSCFFDIGFAFTETDISPETIQTGQRVLVTVELSFTTAP